MTTKKKLAAKRVAVSLDKVGKRTSVRMQPDGKGGWEVNPDKVGLPHGEGELPYDLLAIIEVERVLGVVHHPKLPPVNGLFGHIVSLDYWSLHHKVVIKSFRDPGGIEVLVDGKRVFLAMEDEDERHTFPGSREASDRQMARDSAMAEFLELEEGDEVLDGDDGEIIVKRAKKQVAKKVVAKKQVAKKKPAAKPKPKESDIEWE
jgi:hypothetical protein